MDLLRWQNQDHSMRSDWKKDNPSVQYFVLTEILGKSERSRDVQRAKQAIMKRGTVPKILALQQADGGWVPKSCFYQLKFRGTVWQLIILAEFGADPKHRKVKKTCDYIFENSWSPTSGGFAYRIPKPGQTNKMYVCPCLTGKMTYSFVRLGWFDDKRVQRAIDWIATWMRYDDGDSEPPANHPYRRNVGCYGQHTCFRNIIFGLKALAEIPVKQRSTKVKRCIKRGAEFMLRHRVYRSSHNPKRIGRVGWSCFGFPIMEDALEILRVLTKLDYRDQRMQQAIDLVISKQSKQGCWNLDRTFNGRMQVDIETKHKPSKWITLNALRVLKRYYDHGQSVRCCTNRML